MKSKTKWLWVHALTVVGALAMAASFANSMHLVRYLVGWGVAIATLGVIYGLLVSINKVESPHGDHHLGAVIILSAHLIFQVVLAFAFLFVYMFLFQA